MIKENDRRNNRCNGNRNAQLVYASKDTFSMIAEENKHKGRAIHSFFCGGQQDSGTLPTHRMKAKTKYKSRSVR